ncbi:recombinase family protein [Phaeobacter gallaeciensis]|uniref:recombinase family protein n=2 Tax=Alphaproteobacteria TaxID=28211 RepID=UPI00237EFF59|nr:recombinase family protein [Phaeobacter gallaeciensis]MDE4229979.1 recombinase family protein [Phaeobacter gallaeciensis]MDE4267689.1 recombinase family protein [Phaeobacter gallaeciensis]MDE4296706.1 recombinase family protein [Phaeobacter gallaeciensis]
MTSGKFISYLRVSTAKQGRSGLGLEAQRKAVEDYLNGGAWQIIEEFVEIESGRKDRRPKLAEAIALCRATGATLVVAKIDRLTRNAAFLLSLKEAGIEFVAADMPDANRLTVGIMALVAEQEREAISRRTKEALAAAKARGVQLGAYSAGKFVGRVGTAEDAKRASQARTERYRRSAADKVSLLQRIDPDGSMSLRQIATHLNRMGVPTVSGRGGWSANSVRRLQRYTS